MLLSPKNQETIGAAGGKIVMIGCDLCFYADETTTRVISEVAWNNGKKESNSKKAKSFDCFLCKEADRRKRSHANWTLVEAIICVQDETGNWVALSDSRATTKRRRLSRDPADKSRFRCIRKRNGSICGNIVEQFPGRIKCSLCNKRGNTPGTKKISKLWEEVVEDDDSGTAG